MLRDPKRVDRLPALDRSFNFRREVTVSITGESAIKATYGRDFVCANLRAVSDGEHSPGQRSTTLQAI